LELNLCLEAVSNIPYYKGKSTIELLANKLVLQKEKVNLDSDVLGTNLKVY
jgi:hypothetical protein